MDNPIAPAQVTNEMFLKAVFGENWKFAHVTGFTYDPANIPPGEQGVWSGDYYYKKPLLDQANQFCAVSIFNPDPITELVRRKKELLVAQYSLMIDDVVEKINPDELRAEVGNPSIIIQSSLNSQQWIYIFTVPVNDEVALANLVNGVIRKFAPGEKDPGMAGVTRYHRLPGGYNTKASRIAENFGIAPATKCVEWNPDLKYSIEELAAKLNVDLKDGTATAMEKKTMDVDIASHPLLSMMNGLKRKSVGTYYVTCPWVHEHTDQADNGAAIFTNDDESLGFKCHHSHGVDKNINSVVNWIEHYYPGFKKANEGKLWIDGGRIELTPEQMFKQQQEFKELHIHAEQNVQSFHTNIIDQVPSTNTVKMLSKSISVATDIPINSIFLTGLGVVSSVASRCYVIDYQYAGNVSIGLYTIVEQPSGASKSRSLTAFQKPIFDRESEFHDYRDGEIKRLESLKMSSDINDEKGLPMDVDDIDERIDSLKKRPPFFLSNATAESIETKLDKSGGYFSLASAEQGLLDTLFGLTYSSSGGMDGSKPPRSNNDLVLKGFNREYFSSSRVTRAGYTGIVTGSVSVFAQEGSVDTILNCSNGTGLAERFLLLAEGHNLGNRDMMTDKPIDQSLVENYKQIITPLCNIAIPTDNPVNDEPMHLSISNEGWFFIKSYRQHIEKELKEGGLYSSETLRGTAAKVDINIMKIAANIHLTDSKNLYGIGVESVLSIESVKSAIQVVDELLTGNRAISISKDFIGSRAEANAILNWFDRRGNKQWKSLNDIKRGVREVKPFTAIKENRQKVISEAVDKLVAGRKLEISTIDGTVQFRTI